MRLYFTRHGKTEWNLEKRFQGMSGDSPLLASSYEEIRKFGQFVKDVPFQKIYASSSKRAMDTAKGIAAELDSPADIVFSDDLRELGLGDLEGRSIEGRRKHFGETLDHMRYRLDLYDPALFNGEPIQTAIQRVSKVVEQAVVENHDGPLLFVGHGASLTAAIQWLAGKNLADLRTQGGLLNSSLSILETVAGPQRPYKLVTWNDTSFL